MYIYMCVHSRTLNLNLGAFFPSKKLTGLASNARLHGGVESLRVMRLFNTCPGCGRKVVNVLGT